MINNYWYVGCASSQLLPDKPFATQIGDRNIVLFRDEHGRAHALLDRCCHRGFPLSRSTMTSGRLRCGYHGWEYDGSGRCVFIPSQPPGSRIPDRYRVAQFPCHEGDHHIWVWIGDAVPQERADTQRLSSCSWEQGERSIRCSHVRALENLFDMCHVYYVHPTHPATVRAAKSGFAKMTYELRGTPNGCVVFTPITSEQSSIPRIDFSMEFQLPGTVVFTVATPMGYYYMFFYVTPLGEDLCRVNWLVTDSSPRSAERVRWVGEGGSVTDEDCAVLELIQPSYAREGEAFECSVEGDVPAMALRRCIRCAERGGGAPQEIRRLFSIMTAERKVTRSIEPALRVEQFV